jgi:hypothetical protein
MKPFESSFAISELRTLTIYAGTGPCTLCSCDGYADDGSGFSRCKCGDRKMDHRDQENAQNKAGDAELVLSS